ncbi:MAG: deoxyribose-phosphate aldolase [Taibaiella sp.]|nr:deoxyribose-phosphate aldolase [Taibaiella sp.]
MELNLASYIDHTVLSQTTTASDIDKLCVEASVARFAAVCVPPRFVVGAKKLLRTSNVKLATVIGFPMGYNTTSIKVREIEESLDSGADEADMVIDLCALKSGDWQHLENEIEACCKAVYNSRKIIKVIVESGILTDAELIDCCKLYSNYNIGFMKTSTGFANAGASVHAVSLMRQHLPERIRIKASGGIRTCEFALDLIKAGANRIGTSAGMQIMKEYNQLES